MMNVMSQPLRLVLHFALTALAVWAMATFVGMYLSLSGGWKAIIVIASLLTLMDLLVRPILNIVLAPLKLVATLFALILLNGIFLWIAVHLAALMEPALVVFKIHGLAGWIAISAILGVVHWIMKMILK